MTPQVHLQKVLREQFYLLKQSYPRYSLRSFAKKVSLSPGALSEIMSGNRNVSAKTADRIIARLSLSPEVKEEIAQKFQDKNDATTEKSTTHFQLLSDQFRLICSWEHLSILALFHTIDFKSKAEWISMRLKLPLTRIERALDTLERLALINRHKKAWFRTTKPIQTVDDVVADEAIQISHLADLELAKESLGQHSIQQRDFTSLTLAINPKKIPEAKKAIRDFQMQMESLLEVHPQKEVYKLCIQLFPVTDCDRGEKK